MTADAFGRLLLLQKAGEMTSLSDARGLRGVLLAGARAQQADVYRPPSPCVPVTPWWWRAMVL